MTKMDRFEDALSRFHHGGRYEEYLRLVRLGLNAYGNDGERVFREIMDGAPPPAPDPQKVRRAIRYALENDRGMTSRHEDFTACGHEVLTEDEKWKRHCSLLPPSARNFVHALRARHGAKVLAAEWMSSIRHADDVAAEEAVDQAVRQIRAIHGEDGGFLWAGSIAKGENEKATKRAGAWGCRSIPRLLQRIENCGGCDLPPHVSLNRLTGELAIKKDGVTSYDCLDTVAEWRNVLVEFDKLKDANGLPSIEQAEIVAGMVDLAAAGGEISVASVTWTGGKSLHAVVRVPAENRNGYVDQCKALADAFASAENPVFRVDTTGWNTGANAIVHVRLAGAIRPETGRRQLLLFADE